MQSLSAVLKRVSAKFVHAFTVLVGAKTWSIRIISREVNTSPHFTYKTVHRRWGKTGLANGPWKADMDAHLNKQGLVLTGCGSMTFQRELWVDCMSETVVL